jgi:RING finger protein 170
VGILTAAYLLSPFDIIPEAAFGLIGLLDDLVIVAMFLIYASVLFRNLVAQNGIRGELD